MFNPHRINSFDHKFEEARLLPGFITDKGKVAHYGDCFISGQVEVIYDADGAWWISDIWLETTEWVAPAISAHRKISRDEPFYELVKQAIERECEESINAAVAEHKAEAA